MKTILIPVDFSEYAENALKAATSLAKDHRARLIVMHMIGFDNSLLTKEYQGEALESIFYLKLTQKRFAQFLDKPYLQGVEVEQYVQKYKAFGDIDTIAREHGVDLIVMGSHGSGGLAEVFVGSNTEKVIRSASIPVLVIKNDNLDFKWNRAVFACDFKPENLDAYKRAKELFKTLGTKMEFLYVNLPGPAFKSSAEIEARINFFFESAGESDPDKMTTMVSRFADYTLEEGIFAHSNNVGVDIIAIPTHGRRGLSHFFKGSQGEDLANHAQMPVITFKM